MWYRLFFCLLWIIPSDTFAQTGMNIDSLTRVGAMNAVKKAYQMTDLGEFVKLDMDVINSGIIKVGD